MRLQVDTIAGGRGEAPSGGCTWVLLALPVESYWCWRACPSSLDIRADEKGEQSDAQVESSLATLCIEEES